MKSLYLVLILLSLFSISCQDTSDSEITNKAEDAFVTEEVPGDTKSEQDPICYEDFKRISEESISRKLDILVIPDTSSSIKAERSSIAQGFHHFLNSLPSSQKIDYNIGVLLAHGPKSNIKGKLYKKNHDPYVLKSSELSIDEIKSFLDLKIHMPKEDGSSDGGEMGMFSLLEALKPENLSLMKSQGLFREDAALAVVFIADEQDICAKYPEGIIPVVDGQNGERKSFVSVCIEEDVRWQDVNIGSSEYTYKITPQLVYDSLKSVVGENNPVIIGGVLYDQNSTIPTGNEDEIGYGYLDIIELADGINIDLGTGDYGDGLSKFGRLAVAKMDAPNAFTLRSEKVDPSTIKTYSDSLVVPHLYDAELNSVFIDGDRDDLALTKITYCEDNDPPVINADYGQVNKTKENSIDITIAVSDAAATQTVVKNNSVQVGSSSEASFVLTVPLSSGDNLIEIISTDAYGQSSSITLPNIIRDNDGPILSNLLPEDGSVVKRLQVNVSGESDEKLSQVVLNGSTQASVSDNSFEGSYTFMSEGAHSILVEAFDELGNKSSYTLNFEIQIKLLQEDLITIVPDGVNYVIIGAPGSVLANQEIEISTSFFNSYTVTAGDDGSFSIELDVFDYADISVANEELDRFQNFRLYADVDTTFTGIVKDIDDTPLPGVKVTIKGAGQSAITDSAGVFKIADPKTGVQNVEIDGTVIPLEITNGERKYSKTNLKVNIGYKQQNVLDRTIFLTPIYLDGSQVVVSAAQGANVTSPRAPGVELSIPAGAINFPNGSSSGEVSIIEIPAEKTTISVPEYMQPKTVYHLEPSGVTYSEPVEMSFPNKDNFPEGMELVIISKDSSTGQWQVDGVAQVETGGGSIKTRPNMGVTHHSELFITPIFPRVNPMQSNDVIGANVTAGSLKLNIELPSYKVHGKDVTIGLNYNSLWGKPTPTITNLVSTPTKKFIRDPINYTIYTDGYIETDVEVQSYQEMTPNRIEAKVSTQTYESDWFRFGGKFAFTSNVSFALDLTQLESGFHEYETQYKLFYDNLTVQTVHHDSTIYLRRCNVTFGIKHNCRNVRKKKTGVEVETDELISEVFPPDVTSTIPLINESESSFGKGWTLAGLSKLYSNDTQRVMIDEGDGSVSYYVAKNVINTLFESDSLPTTKSRIKSIDLSDLSNMVLYVDNESPGAVEKIYDASYNISNGEINYFEKQDLAKTPPLLKVAEINGNSCKRYYVSTSSAVQSREPYSIKKLNSGDAVYVDATAGIWYLDGVGIDLVSGDEVSIASTYAPGGVAQICENFDPSCYFFGGNEIGTNSQECQDIIAQGTITQLKSGFSDGPLRNAKFNAPASISFDNTNRFYVADFGNNAIRLVDMDNNLVSTFAGNRSAVLSGDGGQAINAGIPTPIDIDLDDDGNIYVLQFDGIIRKIDKNGVISTYAGRNINNGGVLTVKTAKENVALSSPRAFKVDSERQYIYVADTGNRRIVRIDMVEGFAEQIAGDRNLCNGSFEEINVHYDKENQLALQSPVCGIYDINVDANGNIVYFDEFDRGRIRKLTVNGALDGTLAYSAAVPDGSELVRNADGSWERKMLNGNISNYDQHGFQTRLKYFNTDEVIYEYSAPGKISLIRDIAGLETLFTYNGDYLDYIEDPTGRRTYFQYGSGGELQQVTFPDQTTEKFVYTDGVITDHFDQLNYNTHFEFNEWFRHIETRFHNGDTLANYDSTSPTILSPLKDETSQTLLNYESNNPNGIFDVIVDANGNTTKFEKDESGYIKTIEDSEGNQISVERDPLSKPTRVTSDESDIELVHDEELGLLLKKIDHNYGFEERYYHNSRGQIFEAHYVYPDNRVEKEFYFYDSRGRTSRKINREGKETSYTYFDNNLIQTITNDLGETETLTYDSKGNLESRTSHSGITIIYKRDSAGNIVEKEYEDGSKYLYTFDNLNRLTSVATGVSLSDPVGKVTTYEFNDRSELLKIIDPNGNSFEMTYDTRGRMTSRKDPLGNTHVFNFDGNGNVVFERDPNGNESTMEYDSKDRLTRKSLVDDIYVFQYDSHDNLTFAANNLTSVTNSYIKFQNKYLLESTEVAGVTDEPVEIVYGYNDNNQRQSMSTQWGNFSYQYNSEKMLSRITNPFGEIFDFGYDEVLRLKTLTRVGVTSTISRDPAGLISAIHHNKGAAEIYSEVYTRNLVNNINTKSTTYGNHNFGYNSNQELTGASNTSHHGADQVESFSYDEIGNRISDAYGSHVMDEKGQRLVSDYKFHYLYDNNGNLTSKQEKNLNGNFVNYTYNSQNQLIKIEEYQNNLLTMEARYFYDALGRRYKKEVTKGIVTDTRKFIYDGQEILAELNENDELLGLYTHSARSTDDTLSVRVTSAGVGKLANSAGSYFYLKDQIGSVTDIINSSGNLVQHYFYSSFGKINKIINSSGSDITASPLINTCFTYTNREFDSESGMYYYRARYYEPTVGRFIQSDPHPGKLDFPNTLVNKYSYVNNNPLSLTDPSGRFFKQFFDDLGRMINGIGQAVLDLVNSEAFRVALIIAAAVVTGWAVGALISNAFVASTVGSILGGYVGGEVGAIHATMAGEGKHSASIWRGNGRVIGSIAGGWSAKSMNKDMFPKGGRNPAGFLDDVKRGVDAAEATDGFLTAIRKGFMCAMDQTKCGVDPADEPFNPEDFIDD